MAHLKARHVRDGLERKQWKWQLIRRLYRRGFARQEILVLLRFIDRCSSASTSAGAGVLACIPAM
jgi:hypothetical protein